MLSNSRCRVNYVAVWVPGLQGDLLELNLGLLFTPAFAGAKTVYISAKDKAGLNSGWQNRGTWTVPVNHSPHVVSVTPNPASGYRQQFSFVFSDLNGVGDLRSVQLYFNPPGGGLPDCGLHFSLGPTDYLYLLSPDGTQWTGSAPVGSSSGTIEHTRCGVSLQQSSITRLGTQLTISLDLFFKLGSEGAKQIFPIVWDSFQQGSIWQQMGTWTVGSSATTTTTGVFRPSNGGLFLKSLNTAGFANRLLTFGLPGDKPVAGDWNGDGIDTIGVFRNGVFYLRNANTDGFADLAFGYGAPTDLPDVGDWDGDGIDTIGVFRNGLFILRNSNTTGPAEAIFGLGIAGDIPISGDWDGDGVDTVGIFRPSNGALYLKNQNSTGFADVVLTYGLPGDKPVTGDWDGNGTDTIGVFRNGIFLLRNSNTNGFAEIVFGLGVAADEPISGIWGPL
jgi:hypothetical protein